MEANSPVGRVLVVDDDQVLRKALCGIVAEGGWETAETAETAVSTTVNSMWAALGDLFKCKLPNGIELSIPKLGVETRLIDFVEDDTKLVDKTTWFDFDRLLLSADRSATVVGELVKMGIDPKRLSSEGYGDAHPVADNATEEGRQKNRRVSCA